MTNKAMLVLGLILIILGSFELGRVVTRDIFFASIVRQKQLEIYPSGAEIISAHGFVRVTTIYVVHDQPPPLSYKNILISYTDGYIFMSDNTGHSIKFVQTHYYYTYPPPYLKETFIFSGHTFKIIEWTFSYVLLEVSK